MWDGVSRKFCWSSSNGSRKSVSKIQTKYRLGSALSFLASFLLWFVCFIAKTTHGIFRGFFPLDYCFFLHDQYSSYFTDFLYIPSFVVIWRLQLWRVSPGHHSPFHKRNLRCRGTLCMRGVCSFTVKELQWFLVQENMGQIPFLSFSIQPFRQRLSHESEYKSVKEYATIPIGIIGSKSLALLNWVSRWFSNEEGERMNTRVYAVSFHHAETPWGSIKQM